MSKEENAANSLVKKANANELILDETYGDEEATMIDFCMSSDNVEEIVCLKEQKEALYDAIINNPKIKEENKKLIILKYYENYSQRQIAKLYNVSPQNISTKVKSNMEKVKKMYIKKYIGK